MKVNVEINLEHFRYSLVGDGYILKEAEALTNEELIEIFNERIVDRMEKEYYKGIRLGLYEDTKEVSQEIFETKPTMKKWMPST